MEEKNYLKELKRAEMPLRIDNKLKRQKEASMGESVVRHYLESNCEDLIY